MIEISFSEFSWSRPLSSPEILLISSPFRSVGFIDRLNTPHACANKAGGTSKEGAVIHLSGKDGLGIRILFETRENQSFAANLQVERGGDASRV